MKYLVYNTCVQSWTLKSAAVSALLYDILSALTLVLKWLVMVQTLPSLAFYKSHTKNVEQYHLVQMFIGFNNKQIVVTLTSTNIAMATLKEVKDTLFLTF